MKKTILITLAAMAFGAAASGQEIALGERVPAIRIAAWLAARQPQAAPLTSLESIHSSSPAGVKSLERLRDLSRREGERLRIVVVTREQHEKVARMLRPYLSERIGVALDAARGFELFGVRYVPFGVLTDRRNRALWMGNTLQFDEETIQESTR